VFPPVRSLVRVRGRGALSLPLRGCPSPVPGEGGGLGDGAPCDRWSERAAAVPVRSAQALLTRSRSGSIRKPR